MKQKTILAIDTSCDETSVAVTRGTTVLSNIIASQVELHRPYGGVFPTVAKLAHQEHIHPAIKLALQRATLDPTDLGAVAVTIGPGLAPALEVGIAAAYDFASKHHKPLIPANHLEGHVFSVRATPRTQSSNREPQLPALALVISGGNTLFVKVDRKKPQSVDPAQERSPERPPTRTLERQPRLTLDTVGSEWQSSYTFTILGRTLDDAAGECLDKVGRMLNLGYPAGPVIELFARQGDAARFSFPLPLAQTKTLDMSFSGIKTHSRNLLTKLGGIEELNKQDIYDFCACLQTAVFRHMSYKLEKLLLTDTTQYHAVWLSGGVAANTALRQTIRQTLRTVGKTTGQPPLQLHTPYTKKLCGDNAAMIGVASANCQTFVGKN